MVRRMPAMPTFELKGHTACVDSIAWAPHSSQHICTAGDDSQVLIWDLGAVPKVVEGGVPPCAHARRAAITLCGAAPRRPYSCVQRGRGGELNVLGRVAPRLGVHLF